MKIVVGSTNPVEVGAARSVIERIWFPLTGAKAPPMSMIYAALWVLIGLSAWMFISLHSREKTPIGSMKAF